MSSHPAIKDLFGIRIDKFLSSLSDEAKRKMWPIVNALRLELELSGSTTFPVPVDKLRRNRCSDEDTKAVLANLHRQGILSVSVRYKIKYRPDEFSVQTIDEHPEIYDYPQATISLKKEQLAYLYTKLELFVHPEKLAAAKNAIKILSTRNKTGQYSEIDNIVKRVEQECMAIEDGTSHRSLRDFWLNTKRVLDIICSKLYSGLDGQPKQEIPISLDEFYTRVSLRQKRVIHETLDNLINKGVVSAKKPTLDDESIFIRTDGIFYNGHTTLVIKNAGYLKDLRHKIATLAEFIEKDGKNRFPLHYPPQPEKLQQQLKAIKTYSDRLDQEERIADRVIAKEKKNKEAKTQDTRIDRTPHAKTASDEKISKIDIKKDKNWYYILLNDKIPYKTRIRGADETEVRRYWDYILEIAEKGISDVDPAAINGVLQYFNSASRNPMYKKLKIEASKIILKVSDVIRPNITIVKMKRKTWIDFFE